MHKLYCLFLHVLSRLAMLILEGHSVVAMFWILMDLTMQRHNRRTETAALLLTQHLILPIAIIILEITSEASAMKGSHDDDATSDIHTGSSYEATETVVR